MKRGGVQFAEYQAVKQALGEPTAIEKLSKAMG